MIENSTSITISNDPVVVTSSLTLKAFLKHYFSIQYNSYALFMLLMVISYYGYRIWHSIQVYDSPFINLTPVVAVVFIGYVGILWPAWIFFDARKTYKTNKFVSQKIYLKSDK